MSSVIDSIILEELQRMDDNELVDNSIGEAIDYYDDFEEDEYYSDYEEEDYSEEDEEETFDEDGEPIDNESDLDLIDQMLLDSEYAEIGDE